MRSKVQTRGVGCLLTTLTQNRRQEGGIGTRLAVVHCFLRDQQSKCQALQSLQNGRLSCWWSIKHTFTYISWLAGRFSYTLLLSRKGGFLARFSTAKVVAPHEGICESGSLEGGASAALFWNEQEFFPPTLDKFQLEQFFWHCYRVDVCLVSL